MMTETIALYGIQAMLRTRNGQLTLWDAVLPEVCLRLPTELERVDAWLEDERFFAPFRAHFDTRIGRPSVPVETYLRLMFLKFRYRLGYESLLRGGVRLDLLAAILPDQHRRPGAASRDTDEDHHPVRRTDGGRAQRRGAGQGQRGEGGETGKSPRRHHRGVSQRRATD